MPGLRGFAVRGHTERGGSRALMLTSRSQMMMLGKKKNTRARQRKHERERGREETRIRGVETLQPANSAGSLDPRALQAALRMDTRTMAMPSPVAGLLGCCFLFGWALGVPRTLRSLPALSSKVKPGSVPFWVPPEGAEAALAFLYSGDPQRLSGANCSERYEAPGAGARPGLPQVLWRAAGTVTQAANFLNMLLQANDIRESSVEEDVEWYQALVRSVAEGDPRAYRALLTFNPPPGASHLQLALQATRIGEETILQDLSGSRVQEESSTGTLHPTDLQKRVLTNDLGSLGSPKWPQGDGYVGDVQHVRLSPPFLECQEGRLRPGWLITLSATFYGLKPDLSPEVR